jgi:hypothetical protein
MNVIVLFSQADKLKEYLNFSAHDSDKEIQYHYVSTQALSDIEQLMLAENNITVYEADTLKDAFSYASEIIVDNECVITTVDVVPKGGWLDIIEKNKLILSDMGAVIGRWYKAEVAGRRALKTKNMGVKFIDSTPNLISDFVIDHSPVAGVHAKKISRFPVFFNWFSADMSTVVANCMKECNSFSDFSHFLSDHMSSSESKYSIYYINNIEVIDIKMLR